MSKFPQPVQTQGPQVVQVVQPGQVQLQQAQAQVVLQPGQAYMQPQGAVAAPAGQTYVVTTTTTTQPGQYQDSSGRDTQLIFLLVGLFCFPPIWIMGCFRMNSPNRDEAQLAKVNAILCGIEVACILFLIIYVFAVSAAVAY